jgi:MoaA/NifB/PqqE/SkfB family radical SAM enzyme
MTQIASISLWIELTEACQIKCRFCYNSWRSAPAAHHRAMNVSTLNSIHQFATRLGNAVRPEFILAGGDPTSHPEFVDFAERLSAQGRVYVVTHGTALDAEAIARLARCGNVSLQFSIPSTDADLYRFLTGGGCLDRAVQAALVAREAGIRCSISAVITAQNIAEAPLLVHLGAEIGAEYIVLNKFLPAGRGGFYEEEFAVDDNSFTNAVDAAASVGRSRGIRVLASGALPGVRGRKLRDRKITVGIDGQIRICSLSESVLGHVDDGHEIIDRYDMFWRSTERLPGCFCSALVA